jgi:2-dehydro-3-deoxygluconokinase
VPELDFLSQFVCLADALGYAARPSTEADSFEAWLEGYHETVRKVAVDYPNLSLIGTQWRAATNADIINWGAVLYETTTDQFYTAPVRRNIPIADRTGGGDSFASGVLAALLKGKSLEEAVQWGAAHGILVLETPGDITLEILTHSDYVEIPSASHPCNGQGFAGSLGQ